MSPTFPVHVTSAPVASSCNRRIWMLCAPCIEERLALDWIRDDGSCARLPVGRTAFPVLIGKLESLDQPQGFVHAPSHRLVVDLHGSHHLCGIDDEEPAQCRSVKLVLLVLHEYAVGGAYPFAHICHQRQIQVSQTSKFTRRFDPGQMGVMRVGADRSHFGSDLVELLHGFGEGHDFRGTHEGEVERIEKQHQPFPTVIVQGKLHELLVDHGLGTEARSWVPRHHRPAPRHLHESQQGYEGRKRPRNVRHGRRKPRDAPRDVRLAMAEDVG
mmetsp:Transcript_9288/g.32791  ORF Transcript_9288/g.32791 Transcript_9288/m.32791 type:complete len:271 (-) Transcript_9288:27-839(-)